MYKKIMLKTEKVGRGGGSICELPASQIGVRLEKIGKIDF